MLEIGHFLVEMASPGLGNLCQVLYSGRFGIYIEKYDVRQLKEKKKILKIASVGVTPRTKQLGVTPRTPLFEGKNPENQKTKISIKKGRLLLVNDQGFSQIRPT